MKIICTDEERQALLNSYEENTELHCCLAKPICGCMLKYTSCRECLKENIEWEIVEHISGKEQE